MSSDCKPIRAGGELAKCVECGAVQKAMTETMRSDCAAIYDGYDVYYQGGGIEQMVCDTEGGGHRRRSDVLADRLVKSGTLPKAGRAIDLGCGNGVFLKSLSSRLPEWRFWGLDLDDRYGDELREIPRFQSLIVDDIANLDQQFDLISMIHALEHFPDPAACLAVVRRCLSPDGRVFVQVPDWSRNPFDLLIADHVSHFTPMSLERLLNRCGFAVERMETGWIGKEISLVARVDDGAARSADASVPANEADVEAAIAWLRGLVEQARPLSHERPFGLFGTSIAATWLAGAIGLDNIDLFVDEDPARQGRSHLDRPIMAPDAVPPDATVLLGLAPELAHRILGRSATWPFKCVAPTRGNAHVG